MTDSSNIAEFFSASGCATCGFEGRFYSRLKSLGYGIDFKIIRESGQMDDAGIKGSPLPCVRIDGTVYTRAQDIPPVETRSIMVFKDEQDGVDVDDDEETV